MTELTAGIGGMGALIVAIIWLLYRKIELISRDFSNFRLHVAEQYVGKEAMSNFQKEVLRRFDRLEKILLNGRKEG